MNSGITKEKFNAYRRVQFSGVTNMFMVSTVMELSGLAKTECFDIMKNYTKYKKKFGKYDVYIGKFKDKKKD